MKDARVAIVGLGLMGGSLGLALKQRSVCREVVGLVRRDEAIQQAENAGVVDYATKEPAAALQQADLVVLATPVRTIITQLETLAPFLSPNAIVTDMGSTKQAIMRAMAALPDGIQPVGSHPMCGKEQAGMAAADADLYENAPWIVTPSRRSSPAAIQIIRELAESVGAKSRVLAADRHDQLVAAISHLPYALATTLILTAIKVANDDPVVWEIVASGFRDTSRVAASEVNMMVDILLTNRPAVERMLAMASVELDQFRRALISGDEQTLRTMLEQAAQQRKLLY